jgi:hypothetical protein
LTVISAALTLAVAIGACLRPSRQRRMNAHHKEQDQLCEIGAGHITVAIPAQI